MSMMNLKMILWVSVFHLVFLSGFLTAQTKGSLQVKQDPRIERLVENHILMNETRDGFSGFRIQIFFDSGTNSKIRAQSVSSEFSGKYPGIPVYLTYTAPNYKVRIGDFRGRLDALFFLKQIQVDYPSAYVIAEQIKLPSSY